MYVYIHLYTTAHNPLVYANFLNSTEEKIKCENDKSRAEEVKKSPILTPFFVLLTQTSTRVNQSYYCTD